MALKLCAATRQVRELLGVPIRSLAWMKEHVDSIDAVIRQSLKASPQLFSWKVLLADSELASRQIIGKAIASSGCVNAL